MWTRGTPFAVVAFATRSRIRPNESERLKDEHERGQLPLFLDYRRLPSGRRSRLARERRWEPGHVAAPISPSERSVVAFPDRLKFSPTPETPNNRVANREGISSATRASKRVHTQTQRIVHRMIGGRAHPVRLLAPPARRSSSFWPSGEERRERDGEEDVPCRLAANCSFKTTVDK